MVTGLLTYIAIFGLTAVWILGWMGLSVVIGSFFNLPLKTVALVGATLGPLGFVVAVAIGILESREANSSQIDIQAGEIRVTSGQIDDPFA